MTDMKTSDLVLLTTQVAGILLVSATMILLFFILRGFERRFYTAWAEAALSRSPTLVAFSGARRNELIAQVRSRKFDC